MSEEIPTGPAARLQPSASYSFTMRLHMPQKGGAFARVARAARPGSRVRCARGSREVGATRTAADEYPPT